MAHLESIIYNPFESPEDDANDAHEIDASQNAAATNAASDAQDVDKTHVNGTDKTTDDK